MLNRATLAILTLAAASASAAPRRPNILLAIADDLSAESVSFVGNPVVTTPVYDRIAREGVHFTNAFCVAPSCSPSRAGLLTGRQFWELKEAATLHGQFPPSLSPYTTVLERNGYHVGLARKGYGPGDFQEAGWPHNPAGKDYKDFAAFLKARPLEQPFCFWFGSHDPHRPYEPGSGAAVGLDPAKVRVPAFLPDNETVRHDMLDYYGEVQRFDREVGEMLALLEERGELDNTIVIITGDNGMPFPRAKANLYDAGTRVPLAVRYPARFTGGRTVTDYVTLADLAPTILEAAGLEPLPEMTAQSLLPVLTSTTDGRVDPAREFVVIGFERHTPIRPQSQGYPARAIRTDDYLYIHNLTPERWPAGDPPHFSDIDRSPTKQLIYSKREDASYTLPFQLAFGRRPPEELYILRSDPDQINNLADFPEYAGIKSQLRERMENHLRATNDPRMTEEHPAFENNRYFGSAKSIEQLKQTGKPGE